MARGGALEQLERILDILPTVSKEGGASFAELEQRHNVSRKVITDDLNEVLTRAYYHPAGSGASIQAEIEPDRVRITTTGAFQRPPKLSAREALAVALGLRALGVSPSGETDDGRDPRGGERLARRIEAELSSAPADALEANIEVHLGRSSTEVRSAILEGYGKQLACHITYLGASAEEPSERIIHPYAIVDGEGIWYVIGHCCLAGGMRVFRMDRILSAEMLDESFQRAGDFDAGAYVENGTVFRSDETEQATVRYDPSIARWIRERVEGTDEPDGGFVVRHRVADPDWLVRHVLGYGGAAELVEPAQMRALVVEGVGWVRGCVNLRRGNTHA